MNMEREIKCRTRVGFSHICIQDDDHIYNWLFGGYVYRLLNRNKHMTDETFTTVVSLFVAQVFL